MKKLAFIVYPGFSGVSEPPGRDPMDHLFGVPVCLDDGLPEDVMELRAPGHAVRMKVPVSKS
jgi:hypothetical protein